MQPAARVIYVHGFGGRDNAPAFHKAFNDFLKARRLRFDLQTFAWDSLPMTLQTLVYNFLQSQYEAKQAGQSLLELLHDLDAKKISYHLIGFSLGAAVIRYAFELQQFPLTHLRSVYLLGAAFNHDESINDVAIPPNTRCHNYFSQHQDVVLHTLYYNATGTRAAGTDGLTQTQRFQNYATACTHALAYDYTMLAKPIGSLIAWDEGQYMPGSVYVHLPLPTWGRDLHWNDICCHHDFLVQQNTHTGHFRAIDTTPQQRRKVWASNLHAVFRAI